MTSLATPQPPGPEEQTREASSVRGLLDREPLLQMLDHAMTKRVTVISAPPGSGKTSLLRVWAGSAVEGRHVAFVSVEHEQRSAQRFWSDVLDAIRFPIEVVGGETHTQTTSLETDALLETVRLEVAGQARPVVLIIDDLHELKSTEAFGQIEELLASLPSSARVVFSSRRDPPIRLHRLRLADDLAEIRADDLRFTEPETRELLASSGISLSSTGATALRERTEGWAAGLRLAIISLSGHPDPERFVAEFSGTDRAIGEYLMAEMLERQPSEVQTMLLRTSILDRVNDELADLLSGRSGSEQVLLALEDANAFVVSLDPERTWFRYHQLLGDFLRLELRRTLADEVHGLHRAAAQWFADYGDVLEAVRHLLAAGDWPAAARLLADDSLELTLDGREGTISALLRSFPESASADHPDLALARAATEVAHGRLAEAAAQLALAESNVDGVPAVRRRRLTLSIASVRLALARRSGRFTDVIEHVNLLESSIADESSEPIAMSSELRGVALMNLGIVEMWSGRLADADRHLAEGAALARELEHPYLEVACRAHRCFASKQVSVAVARERGRRTVELAEQHGFADRTILAPALAAVGGCAIWMGEFDEGDGWLRRAWEVADPEVDPAAAVFLHVTSGMLHSARGQQRAALDAFTAAAQAQARLMGVHALAPRIMGWLAATQARLGMLDEARATLNGHAPNPGGLGATSAFHNARAVISMADGDPASALQALQEVRDTTQGVHAFTLVEAHLLAGLAHLQLADAPSAVAAAEAALAVAEPDRLIFPFALTQSGELLDVLPRHETAHAALLADVLDMLRGAALSGTARDNPSSSPVRLSPTELRVLRFMPTNMTRSEIAGELYVTVNTVNTHVRNIYYKLDVRDRSSAVKRARELRLLSTGRSRASRN
jgi:LuxR family maltose regulon positive regulatory protein